MPNKDPEDSEVRPSRGLVIHSPRSNVIILKRQIGRGSFSTCWLAKVRQASRKRKQGETERDPSKPVYPDSNMIVVKMIAKDEKAYKLWQDESVIHQNLVHPGIVKMFDSFKFQTTPISTLEWCRGGDLSQLRKNEPLDVAEIRSFTVQLLSVIQFLHENGIVHRDIKPANILLANECGKIKLCDFGLAVEWRPGDPLLQRLTGTPNYVAPEIIRTPKTGYTELVDCWSAGCTIYFMYTGKSLYQERNKNRKVLYYYIRNKPIPPYPAQCKESMHTVLVGLLKKNPSRRFSAEHALSLLKGTTPT